MLTLLSIYKIHFLFPTVIKLQKKSIAEQGEYGEANFFSFYKSMRKLFLFA